MAAIAAAALSSIGGAVWLGSSGDAPARADPSPELADGAPLDPVATPADSPSGRPEGGDEPDDLLGAEPGTAGDPGPGGLDPSSEAQELPSAAQEPPFDPEQELVRELNQLQARLSSDPRNAGEVMEALERLLQRSAGHPLVHARRGMFRVSLGNGGFLQEWQAALDDLDAAARSGHPVSEDELFVNSRAVALVSLNRYAEVVEYLAPRAGRYPWLDLMLASAHRLTGRLDEAERLLHELQGREPDYFDAVLEHGNLLFAQQRWEEARARYRQAFELASRKNPAGPNAIQARRAELTSCLQTGRTEEAAAILKWLEGKVPFDERLQLQRTALWLGSGRFEDALNLALEQWRTFRTERSAAGRAVIKALLTLGRRDDARAFLGQALRELPQDPELRAAAVQLFGSERGGAAPPERSRR